jgi:hypothetical protein
MKIRILYKVSRIHLTGDQPCRTVTAYENKTQKKRRQTSMPRVGFEPTIPVFERSKTYHASDITSKTLILAQYQEEGGNSGLCIIIDL